MCKPRRKTPVNKKRLMKILRQGLGSKELSCEVIQEGQGRGGGGTQGREGNQSKVFVLSMFSPWLSGAVAQEIL